MGESMTEVKPRVRVKAGTTAFPMAQVPAPRSKATARWLRDSRSGVLTMRQAGLIDSREDIRRVWDRVSALALDFIQNSGRLKGAVDQVLADTVGTELKLNARPDLSRLGYSDKEAADFSRLVEKRWRQWAWNPAECDARGKFTIPQLVDIGLRHQIAFGEATGIIDYMTPVQRRRYGIESGVKVCMFSPHRLVRDTSEVEGLFTGVIHDENGRPVAYRFKERRDGLEVSTDYPARDRDGRQIVIHAFDPVDASDVRGISVIASAMRTHAHAEQLGDATLTTAILQTVFAATLTSPQASAEAFQAIEELEEIDADLKDDFLGYLGAKMDAAREGGISIDGNARVSHLAPGEKLEMHTASTPGGNYIPFSNNLLREMARCLGITFEALSMDHSGATYSSVRMGNASIWPVVMRRRERIAAPICQAVYENWLDEEIGEGRIPFKGGYAAFQANRNSVTWAEWQGPAKPSADDYKSAKAATERLQNGTSTLAVECGELGLDVNDVIAVRATEIKALAEAGLPNPFERVRGGGGSPIESAREGAEA
jgi:lambda family phage portal protein